MTQPTNLYDRYDAATNVREDLIDKITLTNPEENAADLLVRPRQRGPDVP